MRKVSLIIILMVSIFVLPLLASCGENEAETTITIGYLTRLNPMVSSTDDWTLWALREIVNYYNEQELIPGVRIGLTCYNGAHDDTGEKAFKQLIDNGADLVFTRSYDLAELVKPLADQYKTILFTPVTIDENELKEPGYVFCIDSLPRYQAHVLLEWIAANDPDFPSNRPARIGGTRFCGSYMNSFFTGLEEYAEAHPDSYEWVEGYQVDWNIENWDTQIEGLKGCDYVVPPVYDIERAFVEFDFVEDYRAAGYKAKLIGTQPRLMQDLNWYDGMLFTRSSRWCNEDDEMMNLSKKLWDDYFGNGLFSCGPSSMFFDFYMSNEEYVIFNIIAYAAETYGPENLNSEALYNAAQSFSLTIDGVERYSFNETKRTAVNYVGIYELRADEENIFRVDPDWYPVVSEP